MIYPRSVTHLVTNRAGRTTTLLTFAVYKSQIPLRHLVADSVMEFGFKREQQYTYLVILARRDRCDDFRSVVVQAARCRILHVEASTRGIACTVERTLFHLVSDIAIFVLKRDVKLQLTN